MAVVALHLSQSKARVGRSSVPVALVGRDLAIDVADHGAVQIRAIEFGIRSRIVRAAAATASPIEELGVGVAVAAGAPHEIAVGDVLVQALSLHLAGALGGGFGFAAEVGLLARVLGWSPEQIASAEAAEVDALAAQWRRAVEADGTDDGWTRIVLGTDPTEEDLDAVAARNRLAQDLLRRGDELIDLAVIGGAAVLPQTARARPATAGQATAPGGIGLSNGLAASPRSPADPTRQKAAETHSQGMTAVRARSVAEAAPAAGGAVAPFRGADEAPALVPEAIGPWSLANRPGWPAAALERTAVAAPGPERGRRGRSSAGGIGREFALDAPPAGGWADGPQGDHAELIYPLSDEPASASHRSSKAMPWGRAVSGARALRGYGGSGQETFDAAGRIAFALEADAIADILHDIADLRGIER